MVGDPAPPQPRQSSQFNRFVVIWLCVLCVAVLAGGTLLFISHAHGNSSPTTSDAQPPVYSGTDLGATPAPDFTLQDQSGKTVTLSQLKGHPVVLTFFDSVCPHADCSLMAGYINATARDLGPKSANVSWVALSLNPWHDTPQSATTFLSTRQVTVPMHYVLGSVSQLTPLWSAYHMQSILQSDGVVIHTTGVYLIDAQGRERTYLEEGFDPKVASGLITKLLSEPTNATPSTGQGATTTPANSIIQSQTVNGQTVELTATPDQFGTYAFTVTVQDDQGVPVQGATVYADLTMPDMAMEPVHVALTAMPVPGSYHANGVLSMKGVWNAVVTVKETGSAQPLSAKFTFTANY